MKHIKTHSFLQTVAAIATVLSFVFGLIFKDSKIVIPPWVTITLFFLLLFLILVQDSIEIYLLRIQTFLRKHQSSTILIEHKKCRISFLDLEGRKASFYEEIFFQKISNKGPYSCWVKLAEKGRFDVTSIKSNNCSFDLNNHSELRTYYSPDSNKEGYNFFSSALHYSYSANMIDAFMEEKEWWEIIIENPIQKYELILDFPLERPPINPKCAIEGNGDEKIIINPIQIQTTYHWRIILKLFNLYPGQKYVLRWDWPRPEK